MAIRSLDSGADHDARVRIAELDARLANIMRGNFRAFQSALGSLEEYLQDFWRILNLDPALKESLNALIKEQRKEGVAINILLDSIVSQYDRFLSLVTYLRPHSNGCLITNDSAAELHQYTDGRRDEECL